VSPPSYKKKQIFAILIKRVVKKFAEKVSEIHLFILVKKKINLVLLGFKLINEN
jgi:hypothetical protein